MPVISQITKKIPSLIQTQSLRPAACPSGHKSVSPIRASVKKNTHQSQTMRDYTQTNRLHLRQRSGRQSLIQSTIASPSRKNNVLPPQRTSLAKAATTKEPTSSKRLPMLISGMVLSTLVLQAKYGEEKNYFEYRFTTDKDPGELAAFYGSEEFMELFCVVPFAGTLMMRGGQFEDEGGFHTTGLPGKLSVNMVFSDEKDPDSGQTLWFNKRERYKDSLIDHTMWDTVMNFGFRQLPNGKVECYHNGEYFKGSAPPVSLIVKVMFQVHARWLAWATEHHLNHHASDSRNDNNKKIETFSRKDMPLYLIKDHLITDLKAMFQSKGDQSNQDKNDYKDTSSQMDASAIVLKTHNTCTSDPNAKPSFLVVHGKDQSVSVLYDGPITEQLPMKKIKKDIEQDKKVQKDVDLDADDFGYRHLGGNQAWELLRSTNNPEVYQKVTKAAIQRHQTRRNNE